MNNHTYYLSIGRASWMLSCISCHIASASASYDRKRPGSRENVVTTYLITRSFKTVRDVIAVEASGALTDLEFIAHGYKLVLCASKKATSQHGRDGLHDLVESAVIVT